MLYNRLKTILHELIASQVAVTGSYLSNINQVSTRTTREDIKSLDNIIIDNGAKINAIMGKGYQLEIINEKKFKSFLHDISININADSSVPKTPEERVQYLIRRLIFSESFVKIEDLADEIFVSKSTIQNDIKERTEILTKNDFKLESRANYGLKDTGTELNLKTCMSEHILESHKRCNNYILYSQLKLDHTG